MKSLVHLNEVFSMISVPFGTGDIPCGYDICFTDDICLQYIKERILYHACESSISYGGVRISYRIAIYHVTCAIAASLL